MATKKFRQDETDRALQSLRLQAEKVDQNRVWKELDLQESSTPDAVWGLVHELRVHQIELEIQNEELLRIQDELEGSRTRYFELYNLAPVGYLSLSEKGQIIEANLTFATLVGVAREALYKERLTRFIHYEDQDIYYLWRKKLFETGKSQVCELRLVKKDGTEIWMHLEMNLLKGANGENCFRVATSNINERKLAEQALLASGSLFRALLKQASESIIVYDLTDGRIIEVNAASTRMFGYSEAELLQMSIHNAAFLCTGQHDKLSDELTTHGRLTPLVTRYRHKNGSWVYAERTGSLIQHEGCALALISHHDITTERKLQDEIQCEVQTASSIQKAMLPPDYRDDRITIRTIFEPLHLVSGDHFNYSWSENGNVLHGYLLDVSGHGIATALRTLAISGVLNESLKDREFGSVQLLERLNSQLSIYLSDESFATIFTFRLDLANRVLNCVSGGINFFWSTTRSGSELIVVPGSFVGCSESPDFTSITIPVNGGDIFCFMTDGISDQLSAGIMLSSHNFAKQLQLLQTLSSHSERHDDCSAICIHIH